MCLAVVYWQPKEDLPLKVVANRDEFLSRATKPLHWWEQPDILAGQDLVANGSWLGFNRHKQFSLLTNIRPGFVGVTGAKSRGELVTDYLADATISIEQYRETVEKKIDDYAGFNLLLGDGENLFWFSSNNPTGEYLKPGVHALSNDSLNTPWPKATLAREQMQQQHERMTTKLTDHTILGSTQAAPDNALPSTGVPLEWERHISPQTIQGNEYGTRSRTHFTQDKYGKTKVLEQQLGTDGSETAQVSFCFAAIKLKIAP